MLWGHKLSLSLGVLTALGATLLLWAAPTQRDPGGQMFADIGSALLLGAAVALGHGLAHVRQQNVLREFRTTLENRTRGGVSAPSLPRPGYGLDALAATMEKALAADKARTETLLTQKRELEIQLRVADATSRHAYAVLDSIVDAVLVTDPFNEIALANQAAARVLDFDLEQARHQPVEQVVQDPVLSKLIKDTREGGDAFLRRHVEHPLSRAGQTAIYDVTLACVGDASRPSPGELAGVVTILRDVTREREISEMKSDFVSSVSHELRTPLSSIKAYLEMLIDGEARDEATRLEFYNIIQGEASRLARLIDNILNLSRIESGAARVQREQIDLAQLIKEALDVIAPQARAKRLEMEEVPTPLFFQLFADRDLIHQALLNLLGNAVKYTPDGGKVTISTHVDEAGRMVQVSVTDTGLGIPTAALPHLFQKFYRVPEHKKTAKGTGLGLNLVKQIVETVHGGKVSVTSEEGKGSTFTFGLPMADNRY